MFSNPFPVKNYTVGRIIDESKPVHSGNIEYYGEGVFNLKKDAQEEADRLNKESEAKENV